MVVRGGWSSVGVGLRCEKILNFATVVLLFVCDKYCPIIY